MDLLNAAPSEKLGLTDFLYATQTVPAAAQYELANGFLIPASTPCIVTGFAPVYDVSTNFLRVNNTATGGMAFLGWRDTTGTRRYGLIITQNTDQKGFNLTGLADQTYTAYIRFNYVPGAPQNRAYYADGNGGYEYGNLTQTRLVATWELRVEASALTMSQEWLAIAKFAISGGALVGGNITDIRDLYFEGSADPNKAFKPVWGASADRSSTRVSSTGAALISDMHKMFDALKQCLIDIKGPGLQPWYSAAIGGMNIGNAFGINATQTSPKDSRIALGATTTVLQGPTTAAPTSYLSLGTLTASVFRMGLTSATGWALGDLVNNTQPIAYDTGSKNVLVQNAVTFDILGNVATPAATMVAAQFQSSAKNPAAQPIFNTDAAGNLTASSLTSTSNASITGWLSADKIVLKSGIDMQTNNALSVIYANTQQGIATGWTGNQCIFFGGYVACQGQGYGQSGTVSNALGVVAQSVGGGLSYTIERPGGNDHVSEIYVRINFNNNSKAPNQLFSIPKFATILVTTRGNPTAQGTTSLTCSWDYYAGTDTTALVFYLRPVIAGTNTLPCDFTFVIYHNDGAGY